MIKAKEVRIVKEVIRSDGLWHFACDPIINLIIQLQDQIWDPIWDSIRDLVNINVNALILTFVINQALYFDIKWFIWHMAAFVFVLSDTWSMFVRKVWRRPLKPASKPTSLFIYLYLHCNIFIGLHWSVKTRRRDICILEHIGAGPAVVMSSNSRL